jgi:hypothetical protein
MMATDEVAIAAVWHNVESDGAALGILPELLYSPEDIGGESACRLRAFLC